MNTKPLVVLLAISSLIFLGSVFVSSFTLKQPLLGGTLVFPSGGGTGSSTLTGIIAGNGTGAVKSVIIGNNLTFNGTTLSATDSTASSTLLIDNNTWTGFESFKYASSTAFTASGTIYAANFYDTALSGSTCVGEANGLLNSSNCVQSVASAGGTLTISSPTGNVDASLNLAHANTWSVLQTFGGASTTDLTVSNSIFGNFAGGLIYAGASKQFLTQATSSATVSSPLTGAITVVGTGQTIGIQNATASQAGAETQNEFNYVHTATSTFSAPLVYTTGTNAVTCTNASNGVTGCLTSSDWGLLHTATSTFSAPLSYSVSTNAVTCTNASNGVTGCMTANDWGYLHTATTTFSAPLSYSVSTNAVTCPTCVTGGVYPFNVSAPYNSTSTVTTFTGGIVVSASSTFGADAATTTILGGLMLGNAAFNGTRSGTTTVFQMSTSTNNWIQWLLINTSTGSNASACGTFGNNLTNAASTIYYGEICFNGGNYANTAFPAERQNDLSILSSDGGLYLGTASTTLSNASSSIRLGTKGVTRFEILNSGHLVMGTSSPAFAPFTVASSTAPQVAYCDGVATNFCWTERAIGNSYFLATSTPTATSTGAAFSISAAGTPSFFGGPLPVVAGGTASTTLSGILAGNGLNMVNSAQLSAAFGFTSNTLSNIQEHAPDYFATTTLWGSGTTTLSYLISQPSTLTRAMCKLATPSNGNLMNIQFGNGTASTTMMIASSTAGVFDFTANNTFTAGQTLYIDYGATSTAFGPSASTTLHVPCTFDLKI